MGMLEEDPAVRWLQRSADPSVRYLAMRDLLGLSDRSAQLQEARRQIANGPRVEALLANQQTDGGFGVHPYQKWTGAHWRLVSLVELAIPPDDPRPRRATDGVLDWLLGDSHLGGIEKVNGLTRRCASQEGNALGACSYLGLAKDSRVSRLASSLAAWQWPDGGWNCDKKPEAHHSSFAESLSTMWGLSLYHYATGDPIAAGCVRKVAEFFLRHRIFRSHRTGQVVNPELLKLHYPLYWHCDILQALKVLSLAGELKDERTTEALDILESKRRKDGCWHAEGYYWAPKLATELKRGARIQTGVEVVDWGRGGPNEMITLNALRVLKDAHRIR